MREGAIREVDKRDYLKNCLGGGFKEEELVCIFEEYYGHKYRNYECLILGNTRISLVDRRQEGRPMSL